MDIILRYVGQPDIFEYMAAQESEKIERITSVGTADIQKNQIEGAINIYRIWLILKDTQKPVDIRKK